MNQHSDLDDKARQLACIEAVITRIEEIDSEAVGTIAAQDVIDIVLEYHEPAIYNRGLNDAKKIATNKFVDLEIEIASLEKSAQH